MQKVSSTTGWIIFALLFAGCAGEPQVKVSPTAPIVASSQPGQFTFDADALGGLPRGAQAFSGK